MFYLAGSLGLGRDTDGHLFVQRPAVRSGSSVQRRVSSLLMDGAASVMCFSLYAAYSTTGTDVVITRLSFSFGHDVLRLFLAFTEGLGYLAGERSLFLLLLSATQSR